MSQDDHTADRVVRLISVLEKTLSNLTLRAAKPHPFRLVSSGQAQPLSHAYFLWEQKGRIGPEPAAPIGQIRAVMYDQAISSSKISAFPHVVSVVVIELAE